MVKLNVSIIDTDMVFLDLKNIHRIGSIMLLKDGNNYEWSIFQVECFKDACNIVVRESVGLKETITETEMTELKEFILNHFTYHKHKSFAVTYNNLREFNVDGFYINSHGNIYANKDIHRIAYNKTKAAEKI
jgi:hypothetical protein